MLAMNTLEGIYERSLNKEADIELDKEQLLWYADEYAKAQMALARVFGSLTKEDRDLYYGYAEELRVYEKRIADGDNIEY